MTPFDLDAVCGEALFRLYMRIRERRKKERMK